MFLCVFLNCFPKTIIFRFLRSIGLSHKMAAVTTTTPQEQPIDKTQMSIVTAGVWNDKNVIFKRNFKGHLVSTHALANEITVLRYLQTALPSSHHAVATNPVMSLLHSSMTKDARGHKMLEMVQERGQADVFNFTRTLLACQRFEFTQRLMKRVLSIVRTLHACKVAHCDIKPENMVIRDQRHPAESVGFIDFGFACIIESDVDAHVYADQGLWLDNTSFGTSLYRHPNLMQRKPTNLFMADLYACGMVCFTMFADTQPYNSDEDDANIALSMHQNFVDGTWKRKLRFKKHVKEHNRFGDWCDFIDQLCSGKHNYVSDTLLDHAFLK